MVRDGRILRLREVSGLTGKIQDKVYPSLSRAAEALHNMNGILFTRKECFKGIARAIETGKPFPGAGPATAYTWDYLLEPKDL